MESTCTKVADQHVEVLRGLECLLETVEQRCLRLISEESRIGAHRSPLPNVTENSGHRPIIFSSLFQNLPVCLYAPST